GDDSALFNINASTGAVTFKSAPDYENPADKDGDNRSEERRVGKEGRHEVTQGETIKENDVNDNAPVFTSGTTASEAENTVATNVVHQESGTHAHVATANHTSALPLTGDDSALFNINASTGAVTFKSAPDYENPADKDGDN